MSIKNSQAKQPAVSVQQSDQECLLLLSGDWLLEEAFPSWEEVAPKCDTKRIRVVADDLGKWDTALLLFLRHGKKWALANKKFFEITALPVNVQEIFQQEEKISFAQVVEKKERAPFRFFIGTEAVALVKETVQGVSFVGSCVLGLMRLAIGKAKWRWTDCLLEMQRCWEASALIVGFISFLVGVILAFQSAVQLKQYGASILVADLVGLAVVREMGPMMAAIVVAGSTGAGFAAQLGNMKVDEEIDALETLGISSIDFLALPRLLAVTIMMPILAMLANVLGILGGMFISASMLSIPASAYFIETQNRIDFTDVASGIVKSFVFGVLIALAGCLRGIACERTTAGVGKATSLAVVIGIMLIVIADALFAVIYNALGI